MSTPRFKAWDIRNQKMVSDALSLAETQQLVTVNEEHFNNPFSFFDGCKWLMYSSLMDHSNKNEVCEGDIVKFIGFFADEKDKKEGITDVYLTLPVFLHKGCFCVGNAKKYGYLHHYTENKDCKLEILGNVFENSDIKFSEA